jgi:hypothetical protein
MNTFWFCNANLVNCDVPTSTKESIEFADLVTFTKHMQSAEAVPCKMIGKDLFPIAKEQDVAAAKIASCDIVCLFIDDLSTEDETTLVDLGLRKISPNQLEDLISKPGFLRQILIFAEDLRQTQKFDIEALVGRELQGCIHGERWEGNAYILDIAAPCQIEHWGRVFRKTLYEIHDTISRIRSYQGKTFKKF